MTLNRLTHLACSWDPSMGSCALYRYIGSWIVTHAVWVAYHRHWKIQFAGFQSIKYLNFKRYNLKPPLPKLKLHNPKQIRWFGFLPSQPPSIARKSWSQHSWEHGNWNQHYQVQCTNHWLTTIFKSMIHTLDVVDGKNIVSAIHCINVVIILCHHLYTVWISITLQRIDIREAWWSCCGID